MEYPSFEAMWDEVKENSTIKDDLDEYCAALEFESREECENEYMETIEERYDWGIENIEKAVNSRMVYRCIAINDINKFIDEINESGKSQNRGIGTSWTWDKNSVNCYWGKGKYELTMQAIIKPEDIDIQNTIYQSMVNNLAGENEERETSLFGNAEIELISIKYDFNGKKVIT